ncbi:MAG: pseudomurein-binding repeat-containing protein [Methanobacterium sp.]
MGIGGGIITKKLLLAVLLIGSLSLSGLASASAADSGTAQDQTSNTNITNKKVNIQIESNNNSINSATTQKTADINTQTVDKSQNTVNSQDADQSVAKTADTQSSNATSAKTSTIKAQPTTTTGTATSTDKTTETSAKSTTTTNTVNTTKTSDTNTATTTTIPTTVKTEAAAGETKTVSTTTTTQTSFSVADVEDAASRVKAFIEANKKLPKYVTIGTIQVKMPDFLQLLTAGLLQINSGTNNPLTLKSVNNATTPTETVKSGTMNKASYLDLAKRVNSYINANGKLPNYATTSLGKMRYESLIYMFSKVLSFEKTNNRLPSYVSIKSWSAVGTSSSSSGSSSSGAVLPIPAELQKYLAATTNCPVSNAQINALSWSLAHGSNGLTAATNIFNWVRDNLSYSFYYNTKYGAVGALNAGTGNCVDTSHLIVALARATGIPARYEHVNAQFSSGSWYGHVIAQLYVNGKWYYADGTSSRNTFGVINNWNTATATIKGYYASLPF